MNKTGRALLWVALNGFLAYCLYLIAVSDAQWAANIVVFIVWLMLPMHIFCLFVDESHYKLYKRGHSVPLAVAGVFDICVVLVLAALGWFATAAAYFIGAACEQAIFSGPPKNYQPPKAAS